MVQFGFKPSELNQSSSSVFPSQSNMGGGLNQTIMTSNPSSGLGGGFPQSLFQSHPSFGGLGASSQAGIGNLGGISQNTGNATFGFGGLNQSGMCTSKPFGGFSANFGSQNTGQSSGGFGSGFPQNNLNQSFGGFGGTSKVGFGGTSGVGTLNFGFNQSCAPVYPQSSNVSFGGLGGQNTLGGNFGGFSQNTGFGGFSQPSNLFGGLGSTSLAGGNSLSGFGGTGIGGNLGFSQNSYFNQPTGGPGGFQNSNQNTFGGFQQPGFAGGQNMMFNQPGGFGMGFSQNISGCNTNMGGMGGIRNSQQILTQPLNEKLDKNVIEMLNSIQEYDKLESQMKEAEENASGPSFEDYCNQLARLQRNWCPVLTTVDKLSHDVRSFLTEQSDLESQMRNLQYNLSSKCKEERRRLLQRLLISRVDELALKINKLKSRLLKLTSESELFFCMGLDSTESVTQYYTKLAHLTCSSIDQWEVKINQLTTIASHLERSLSYPKITYI